MWTCTCGHQNSEIGNFCVACGISKNAATAAQLSDDVAWFYYLGSQRMGPVSSREIAELLRAGKLGRNALMWKTGMNDWVALHRTALGVLLPHQMPAAPLEAVSDVYAWLMALLPITAGFVLTILDVKPIGVFLANMLITFLLGALDLWEIKRTTGRLETWGWFAVPLLPVYLFIRASKAGQRYGYAIAWCVLYASVFSILFVRAYLIFGL